MFEISVVICTHNPRESYLQRVLAALAMQTLPQSRWELVLVDNASHHPAAEQFDLGWHRNGRHVHESELGIAAARRRGIHEANGSIIVFVDDDNVLDANYLANVLSIYQAHPDLGVWGGGTIVPDFEVQPQAAVKPYLHYLALRTIETPRVGTEFSSKYAMPWGAGMCLRREIGLAYCDNCDSAAIKMNSRLGTALGGGEDVELCIIACLAGYAMGVFPSLKLQHLIPGNRVEVDYLLRLRESHVETDMLLEFKWRNVVPRRPYSARALLALAKHALLRRGLDWKMYLAYWRAAKRSRQLIDRLRMATSRP